MSSKDLLAATAPAHDVGDTVIRLKCCLWTQTHRRHQFVKCSASLQPEMQADPGEPPDVLDSLLHTCPVVLEEVRRSDTKSLSALLATSHSTRNRVSAVLRYQRMVGPLCLDL